jgi:hypothetical protein
VRRVRSTRPAAPARPAVPERAVAGRCVEAHADVGRPPHHDPPPGGPARHADDPTRPKPMWPRGHPPVVFHAGATAQGRDERPDRQRPAAHRCRPRTSEEAQQHEKEPLLSRRERFPRAADCFGRSFFARRGGSGITPSPRWRGEGGWSPANQKGRRARLACRPVRPVKAEVLPHQRTPRSAKGFARLTGFPAGRRPCPPPRRRRRTGRPRRTRRRRRPGAGCAGAGRTGCR